jgi:hypothetical protein
MSLISAALSLFAVLLMLAEGRRRIVLSAWLGGLAVGLWLLPEPAKVAAPLGAILALALGDSVASLRPQSTRD